jgi:hypothetical protein
VAHSVDDSGDSRTLAWSDTGVNDICPKGYSVPTFEELDHEYQRLLLSANAIDLVLSSPTDLVQ